MREKSSSSTGKSVAEEPAAAPKCAVCHVGASARDIWSVSVLTPGGPDVGVTVAMLDQKRENNKDRFSERSQCAAVVVCCPGALARKAFFMHERRVGDDGKY